MRRALQSRKLKIAQAVYSGDTEALTSEAAASVQRRIEQKASNQTQPQYPDYSQPEEASEYGQEAAQDYPDYSQPEEATEYGQEAAQDYPDYSQPEEAADFGQEAAQDYPDYSQPEELEGLGAIRRKKKPAKAKARKPLAVKKPAKPVKAIKKPGSAAGGGFIVTASKPWQTPGINPEQQTNTDSIELDPSAMKTELQPAQVDKGKNLMIAGAVGLGLLGLMVATQKGKK